MRTLYGVILRTDPDKSDDPRLMPSFFELTTDLDEARRVAANVQAVVVQLGHVITEDKPEPPAAHDCPDCPRNGGIGFACGHRMADGTWVTDKCQWCQDNGYTPGQPLPERKNG